MFKNQVAVITGAASGIGQALAVALAREGARLALSDLSAAALAPTLAQLPAGAQARAYTLDVGSREAFFAHADEVQRDFGGADLVINNAGLSIMASFEHITLDEMARVLQVNLWGVIHGSKAFLPGMLARRSGCIVNVSSVFGLVTVPCQVAYSISKFGVRALTETLWQELEGSGVRAVLVHPGGVATNIDKGPTAQHAGPMEEAMKQATLRMMSSAPADVAAQIVAGLKSGAPRLLVGNGAQDLFGLARQHPDDYGQVLRGMLAGGPPPA